MASPDDKKDTMVSLNKEDKSGSVTVDIVDHPDPLRDLVEQTSSKDEETDSMIVIPGDTTSKSEILPPPPCYDEVKDFDMFGNKSTDKDVDKNGIRRVNQINEKDGSGLVDAFDGIERLSSRKGSATSPDGQLITDIPDDEEIQDNKCVKIIFKVQTRVHNFLQEHGHLIKKAFLVLLLLGYIVYFVFCVWYSPKGAVVVISVTSLVVLFVGYGQISKRYGKKIQQVVYDPVARVFETKWWKYVRWLTYLCLVGGFLVFFAIDVCRDHRRVTSFVGMLVLILITFLLSTNPSRVKWKPVIWGLGLQFLLGVAILRWEAGYYFFRFCGDQVKVFLDYADEGSKFVFGEEGYLMHRMAFKVFPIVIYFSAVIGIFYYWGLMQFFVCKIAWLMQFTMGTTAIESLNAATNIFIGMAESCVILRPFLHKLTKSELHAVMTGGFATVAGSYIALLVEVGASPEHLLSAAIMSAPAALAMAKLSYPETEVSHTKTEDDVYMEKTPARNLVEAASNGAMTAVKVVASVAANLIAILGLIAFFNATLSYCGGRVGFPQLSFQLICSYLFWPLAAIMGIDIADARKVASLIGTKIFVDEFISFRDLGIMAANGEIAERSTVIATYACCGFGSIAAMGMYIGALTSVCPQKRGDISEVAMRALLNGNIAGFLTACIAGILYTGKQSLYNIPDVVIHNMTSTLAPVLEIT